MTNILTVSARFKDIPAGIWALGFNLMTGLALLAASVVAGELWDIVGPQGTFLAGALFATLALVGLVVKRR